MLGIVVAAGCRTSAFRDRQTAVVRISGSGVISVAGRRTSVAELPRELRRAGVRPDIRIEIRYEGTLSHELRDGIANGLTHDRFFKISFISSRRVDAFSR